MLAIYPDSNSKLNESQDNTDMAMMQANLVHNSVIYPGSAAGFFDDTGTRYDPAAGGQGLGRHARLVQAVPVTSWNDSRHPAGHRLTDRVNATYRRGRVMASGSR